MKKQTINLVHRWFDGLNRGDLFDLLALFGPCPKIQNAANAPSEGPDSARRLLEDFFHGTTSRNFEVIDMAEAGNQIFACWSGELTFAAGITIGDVCLGEPLTVPLRGVERFALDESGRIAELDIVHETTSVSQAARMAANSNQ